MWNQSIFPLLSITPYGSSHNQYKKDPIVIERNYEEDLPNVQGNFANLGQVFINMIKNAIEALPDRAGPFL
jgi:two-component system NtrC family sensor kinase